MAGILSRLQNEDLSLYAERDGVLQFSSDRAGLRPLLRGVSEFPEAFENSTVADRVVGLAAAYLLIHGKVKEVHAGLVSEEGRKALEEAGIALKASEEVADLHDDAGEGPCPMDTLARSSGGVALFVDELQRQFAD